MLTLESVLACAVRSPRNMATLRRAVTSDLVVANPWYLRVARWAAEFMDEYGEAPRDGDAETWLGTLPDALQQPTRDAWRALRRQDLSSFTTEALADTAARVLRDVAARNALHRLNEVGADPETLSRIAREVDAIRPVRLDGLADLADVDRWIEPPRGTDELWPTGVPKLDSFLGGGVGKELAFLMAGSGIGKTTMLVNVAAAAALRGARVLHVTLELAREKTLHRYYRKVAEATRSDFASDLDVVRDRARHWVRLAQGSVHVLYMPAYEPTVDDVRAVVDVFAEAHGGIDLLVLDYLDLLARTRDQRNLPGWDQLGRMAHEIRNVCVDPGAGVWTAAQATREGNDAARHRVRHVGGAVAKFQAADLWMSLVQSEEEEQCNQARLQLLKVRDNPGRGAEIPLHVDMDVMALLDLDHPDARRLRRKHGLAPAAVGAGEEGS